VHFAGYQSPDAVPVWMAAADVVCLPSLTEGCPNVVLEALACGRPVVASRVGGVPEILSDETGVLISPGSPEELAQGIRRALLREWDPALLRASVLHRSWEHNAADAYDRIRRVHVPAEPRRTRVGAMPSRESTVSNPGR